MYPVRSISLWISHFTTQVECVTQHNICNILYYRIIESIHMCIDTNTNFCFCHFSNNAISTVQLNIFYTATHVYNLLNISSIRATHKWESSAPIEIVIKLHSLQSHNWVQGLVFSFSSCLSTTYEWVIYLLVPVTFTFVYLYKLFGALSNWWMGNRNWSAQQCAPLWLFEPTRLTRLTVFYNNWKWKSILFFFSNQKRVV